MNGTDAMNQHMIPAAVLPGIFDFAISKQINIEALLEKAQVRSSVVGFTDEFLTVEQSELMFDYLVRACNDPALGLHFGENTRYNSHSLMVELLWSAPTVREALRSLVKFKDLITPNAQLQFSVSERLASLSYQPGSSRLRLKQATFNEFVISRLFSTFRWLTGGHFPLVEVRFAHAQPHYLNEYRRVFQVPVYFNCSTNELIFKRDVLDYPLQSALPEFHARLDRLAEEQLDRLALGYQVTRQVSDYLNTQIGVGEVGVEDVASYMNMTPRTLQRKLKQEGLSFAELRDQLRHTMAKYQLRNSSLSMGILATRLGFSDASTFYHAFKRWEGMSPGAYRKRFGKEEVNPE